MRSLSSRSVFWQSSYQLRIYQGDRNREINRIGRLLETANLKLSSVIRNMVGQSGKATPASFALNTPACYGPRQVRNSALRRLGRTEAPVLGHPEVATIFAVLFPVSASQKHRTSSMPDNPSQRLRIGPHRKRFSTPLTAVKRLMSRKLTPKAEKRA